MIRLANNITTARRYFRFFAFIPCFERVLAILGGDFSSGWILSMIQLAKFSALGVYLVLEDLTIVFSLSLLVSFSFRVLVWLVGWLALMLTKSTSYME